MDSATTILTTFFSSIFQILTGNDYPGKTFSFFTFYLTVMIIFIVCSFISRIINIGVNSDISFAHNSKYTTETTRLTRRNGNVVTTYSTMKRKR